MEQVVRFLVAFFSALSAALGGPTTPAAVPDRPVIVAPTPEPTAMQTKSPDATEIEISGVVQIINGNAIVVSGVTVYVGPQTQVKGNVQIGARIKVEGVKRANEIQARDVQVIDAGASSQASSSRSSSSSTVADSSSSRASSNSSEASRTSSSSESRASSESRSSETSQASSQASESSRASSSEDSRSSSSERSQSSSGSSSSKSEDGGSKGGSGSSSSSKK